MPDILQKKAIEESTFIIAASFYDDSNTMVVPNTGLNWTLSTMAGTVINSRSAVAITPATTVYIVLSGNDLVVGASTDDRRRVVTIEGTYDSDRGINLPLKDQVEFQIQDLVVVT